MVVQELGRSSLCGIDFIAEGMFGYSILFLLLREKTEIILKTEIAVIMVTGWFTLHHGNGKRHTLLSFCPFKQVYTAMQYAAYVRCPAFVLISQMAAKIEIIGLI
jgi:hypothetical protein